jgi:hypothetical protein
VIRWCVTLRGTAIPVDPEPRDDGNLVLIETVFQSDRGPVTHTVARQPDALLERDVPRYASHFATCPHAAEHRR